MIIWGNPIILKGNKMIVAGLEGIEIYEFDSVKSLNADGSVIDFCQSYVKSNSSATATPYSIADIKINNLILNTDMNLVEVTPATAGQIFLLNRVINNTSIVTNLSDVQDLNTVSNTNIMHNILFDIVDGGQIVPNESDTQVVNYVDTIQPEATINSLDKTNIIETDHFRNDISQTALEMPTASNTMVITRLKLWGREILLVNIPQLVTTETDNMTATTSEARYGSTTPSNILEFDNSSAMVSNIELLSQLQNYFIIQSKGQASVSDSVFIPENSLSQYENDSGSVETVDTDLNSQFQTHAFNIKNKADLDYLSNFIFTNPHDKTQITTQIDVDFWPRWAWLENDILYIDYYYGSAQQQNTILNIV